MPEYDFKTLSPIDFESLARDLLQCEMGITFESFTTGRDGGIDFRYAPTKNSAIIVQCKHYVKSPPSQLLRDLKRERLKMFLNIANSE